MEPNEAAFDCAGEGEFTSLGYNIFSEGGGCEPGGPGDQVVDPATLFTDVLFPLTDNGGPTPTFAVQPDGPAVDAGNPAGCTDVEGGLLAIDQRGVDRHVGFFDDDSPICDVGAYELQEEPAQVCLCHYPPGNPNKAKTICVGADAAEAHLSQHGDTLGECGS